MPWSSEQIAPEACGLRKDRQPLLPHSILMVSKVELFLIGYSHLESKETKLQQTLVSVCQRDPPYTAGRKECIVAIAAAMQNQY